VLVRNAFLTVPNHSFTLAYRPRRARRSSLWPSWPR